jgi:hypothetical protein
MTKQWFESLDGMRRHYSFHFIDEGIIKGFAIIVVSSIFLLTGCVNGGQRIPKIRMGTLATNTIGTTYSGPDIGNHRHKDGIEDTGIVYTCRAGHIDLAHVRKSIDWTRYIYQRAKKCLEKAERGFTFRLYEPSVYHVIIAYPDNWQTRDSKEKRELMQNVAIEIGGYMSFAALTWHEMLTWLGWKSTWVVSEYSSAFSWEDNFSNFLGALVGKRALHSGMKDWDLAVTQTLHEMLHDLGIQSKEVSKRAGKKVKDSWYSGDLIFVDMKKRHFDIGVDDGEITPIVIPVEECKGKEPEVFKVPNTRYAEKAGFQIRFEIAPKAQKEKIRNIIGTEKVDVINHFPIIIRHIREEAINKYGRNIDVY